jgi:hypothetical protein
LGIVPDLNSFNDFCKNPSEEGDEDAYATNDNIDTDMTLLFEYPPLPPFYDTFANDNDRIRAIPTSLHIYHNRKHMKSRLPVKIESAQSP